MPSWTSLGHGMRRRMGAPSSHLEATGASMKSNSPTPEDVIASAAHSKSPRRYMGMDANKFTNASAQAGNTIRMPRKNTQAADPVMKNKANRTNKLAGSAAQSERMGARYEIGATFPAVHSIEASATMRNAKTIPSVMGRQAPDFNAAMGESY
jgi:hypothetical protein